MALSTSQRIQALKPSATLAVSAKAEALRAEGKNIINLGLGEPDFPTPPHICEAAIQAIHNHETHYTAVDGTKALKDAIMQKLERDNQLTYIPNQVIASSGAKQSLFNLFLATLNPGDEVVIPAPYWVSYPDMVKIAEATPVIVSTQLEHHYKMTADELKNAITPKTKMLILNSPSNPTGACYTHQELKALAEVLLQHPDILIVSDDIYEKILWSAEKFSNILMVCPELYERTVIVNGVSKAYAMTGWRLGYAAGPAPIIAAAKKIQSQSTSNPCSITQAAAVAALTGDQQCLTPMVAEFKKRYDFMFKHLNAIPGFHVNPCVGAFYVFPNVSGAIEKLTDINDDIAFAEFLLTHAGVACVPGSAFGAPGCLRLSYATNLENLKKAVDQIRAAIG